MENMGYVGETRIPWETVEGFQKVETKEQYEKRCLDQPLHLSGKATDHIWLMEDVEGYIGIRMDSGDSGTVYLRPLQAKYLAEELLRFLVVL